MVDISPASAPPELAEIDGPQNRISSLVRLVTLRPPAPTGETEVPAHGFHLGGYQVDPAHLERYRTIVRSVAPMPLAYPATVTMPLHLDLLADGRVPVRPLGMVYLGFEVSSQGSLTSEEPWDVSVWVEGTRHTSAGLEFDTVAEISGSGTDGTEAVWRTRSALLMRSRSAAGEDASTGPDVPDAGERWEAITSMTVKEDTGRSFARLNGDFNPIHMHALAAKPFGFPRAIAHGWWSLGRILALLDQDEPVAGGELTATISFRKPVLCPSRPTLARREQDGVTRFALLREDDPETLLVGGTVTQR